MDDPQEERVGLRPMSRLFSLVLIQLYSCLSISFAQDAWQERPLKKLSEVELKADILKGTWRIIEGLRADDLTDLSQVPEKERELIKPLVTPLRELGVRSIGDFTLTRVGFPLNTVTVRIFVFESVEKCQTWWKKKYRYEGWQEHYSEVTHPGMVSVESRQSNKLALASGKIWLTTHQLQDGDEHLLLADELLQQLTLGELRLKISDEK